jgi:leukotriene-A4 hydrolase
MDTEGFKKYIKEYYDQKFHVSLADTTFNAWIDTEGLPANITQPSSSKFKAVDDLLAGWKAEKPLDKSLCKDWSTQEWLHFLKNLPQTLTPAQMKSLDDFGNLTKSGNAEIITAWGVISIRNNYTPMNPKLEEFLVNTGRRKFLSPLYNEMLKTEDGKKRAKAIYQKARPNYHFVATNTFDKLIQ